jgi:BlaI family penicillinase repressor
VGSQQPSISAAEMEVLKLLWEQGPGTVREVRTALRQPGKRWAHNTVWTLLQRLEAKGYVVSDKGGWAHVFRAAVSRDDLLRQRLEELATELCQGASGPLVLALVEGGRCTPEEIEQFRKMLGKKPGEKK